MLNTILNASQFALLYGADSTFVMALDNEADFRDDSPVIPRWPEFCEIARRITGDEGKITSLYWALVQRPRTWKSESDLKTWILREDGFAEFREWVIEKIPEDGRIYLVLICESRLALQQILNTQIS